MKEQKPNKKELSEIKWVWTRYGWVGCACNKFWEDNQLILIVK